MSKWGAVLDALRDKSILSNARTRLLKKRLITTDGCWLFKGCKDKDGYGKMRVNNDLWRVHRLSLFLFKPEEYKEGSLVLHKCDTPACFNPEHLFSGTHEDNKQDALEKGKNYWAKQTYCPKGHYYTTENTYVDPKTGGRKCRTCHANNEMLARSIGIR